MKAGKSMSSWHSCMSVAVVGALALAVSVQGSPRAGERGKTDGKSGTTRLVTGPSAHINDAIAAGATAVITLQPIVAPSPIVGPYGAGAISGQTLTLPSVPSRAWISVNYTGWAPDTLKTVQVTISATDAEMDGGGYAVSTCAGVTGPAPSLTPAQVACVTIAECNAALSGTACGIGGGASKCQTWDGVSPGPYFPAGKWCQPGFQNQCQANWGGSGAAVTPAVDISNYNYRYGFTADPGETPTDFAPSSAGTLALDVPANAKGTYTIDAQENQTFLQNDGQPGANNIPIASIVSAHQGRMRKLLHEPRSGKLDLHCGLKPVRVRRASDDEHPCVPRGYRLLGRMPGLHHQRRLQRRRCLHAGHLQQLRLLESAQGFVGSGDRVLR